MGVTVREKDGAWWLFICHQGKRKAKRVGDKRAAENVAKIIRAKLTLGELKIADPNAEASKVPIFEDVAKEWERVASVSWKQGTVISYGNALRARILPTFGKLPIDQITAEQVEAWWTASREAKLSKKYRRMLRAILRGICRRAVRLKMLAANPVECIEGPLGKSDEEVKESDYLTPTDLTAFLAAAERVVPGAYPALLVMASCGLRLGETIGLQVGDLDVAGFRLHVRRTVRRAYISSPKTGKGRVVDVPASTMAVLQRTRELRQVEAAVEGKEPRWLFPGLSETMPITPEAVQNLVNRAARAAGLRKISPHTLRHTYATLAIQAGVPMLTVSRQLGHKKISTTIDTYTHAVSGENRAAAEAMEAILTSNQTQPPRNLPA